MHDEMLHMMLERDVLFARLALDGFPRQHNVAEVTVSGSRTGRKRQYVGGFRDAAKTLVQLRDVGIRR